MRESQLEAVCRKRATQHGGYLLKWQGERGVPDRILTMPFYVAFIEFKTPVGVMSEIQLVWKVRLQTMGLNHFIVRSVDDFQAILEQAEIIKSRMSR